MDLDIKLFMDNNKKLFNNDLTLEEALLSHQEQVLNDDQLGVIVSAYFEKLQEVRECENIKGVLNYVKDDNSKSTIHELDRECSRANRYLQPLCIAMVQFDAYVVRDEVMADETLELLELTIRETLRKTDYVGRLSELELLILLPNTEKALGETVMHKLHQRLNEQLQQQPNNLRALISYTNYERWESYELMLKRLKHGLFKANRDKKQTVNI